jgi:hypothetical protein
MNEAPAESVKAVGGAVAETAKFGGKVVDASIAFGGWLKDTFGTIPEDLLGIAGGDWLHHQRRRNLAALEARTKAIRERIGAGAPHAPSVSVVLPLLQGAADEARPELQNLWAALLASAMQPDGGVRVRRAFFDTLRRMEPYDAKLFDALLKKQNDRALPVSEYIGFADDIGLHGAAATVTWEALANLKLIYYSTIVQATPFGLEFWKACNPKPS